MHSQHGLYYLDLPGCWNCQIYRPYGCFKNKHKEQYNFPSFSTAAAVILVLLWYNLLAFAQMFEEIIQDLDSSSLEEEL